MKIAHQESRIVAIGPERMFDLVADVERYPEFLPLISQAQVVNRAATAYETEQVLAMGVFSYRFHTHTALDRPRSIIITSADPGFRRFEIHWAFAPAPSDGCRIDFSLDCEARSPWLRSMIDAWARPMALMMVEAFLVRARALDGAGHG